MYHMVKPSLFVFVCVCVCVCVYMSVYVCPCSHECRTSKCNMVKPFFAMVGGGN